MACRSKYPSAEVILPAVTVSTSTPCTATERPVGGCPFHGPVLVPRISH